MALSEKDAFCYLWKIKNFCMSACLFDEYLESPPVAVNGTKLALLLYPRGNKDEHYVSCFLERHESSDKEEAIEIGFELILHSVYAKKDIHLNAEKVFEKSSRFGFSDFCLRKNILDRVNGFLPKNTLTIECRMRRIDLKASIPKPPAPILGNSDRVFNDSALQKEIVATGARDELVNFLTQFASNHYMLRTCIGMDRKCFIWPIREFGALQLGQRLSIPVYTAYNDAPSIVMTLYLVGESVENKKAQIEIRIDDSDQEEVFFVRCRITVVNDSMKAQLVADDEHFFKPSTTNDVWEFPTFIEMTNLVKKKYLDDTQGILYLRCEFIYSVQNGCYNIEGTHSVTLPTPCKPLKREFNYVLSVYKQVYEEGKFSDVTIRCGARAFKAHKCILSVRSPVFKAMFEIDMREKDSGVVDITDYDPDTVEQLLNFIYTNNMEDLQQEKAVKLYSVADKYEVLSLKWRCSNFLTSTLSTSNACEVLTLANLHQDGDLLNHVQKYIQLNSDVILRSELWKDLMKSNSSLASRVMLDLLAGEMYDTEFGFSELKNVLY